jgi:hypothetical protein
MKKTLLLVIILFSLYSGTNGQTYSFTYSTSTYTDLSSPIIVSTPYWDDFSVWGVPLPFSFTCFGTAFDSVYISSELQGFIYDPGSGFGDYELGTYLYAELSDNSTQTATVSYQSTGSMPNRIFKIQFKDAAFYNDQTEQDYANYQVWFYETSNVIEIHYGPV